MVPRAKSYVTYYRVSTQQQGRSGLGLKAQQTAVRAHLDACNGLEIASFTEIESGKHNDRQKLQAALKRCRQTRATLLVAKLDRLSRNAAFLLSLRDAGVRFVAADIPEMNETVVGILAVIAQGERKAISDRTKAALAAAKARGTQLGNPNLKPGTKKAAAVATAANQAQARARALVLADVIADAKAEGKGTLRELAEHLNGLNIGTSRGCEWTPTAVSRVLEHLSKAP